MSMRGVTGQGRVLELGRRLDDGGEGVVYEVPGSALVAKLLLQPADPADLERRLASRVRRGRSPRSARLLAGEPRRASWPVATARVLAAPDTPAIHGYLMPDMGRWYRPLSLLLSPGTRDAEFPAATWATQLA